MADKYTIIIERRTWVETDDPYFTKVLATITKFGLIWMPMCLVPMCPVSGVALCSDDPRTALGNTLDHLGVEHKEPGFT